MGHRCWSGISSPLFSRLAIGLLQLSSDICWDWPSSQWEAFADNLLLVQVLVFALQALSSPAPMSFCHAETSSEVTLPGASPSSPSLPSGGRDEGEGESWDALVLLPEGLPLLPLDFCPARGVEETLVARLVHASSLLSPRFICRLGVQGNQELLFCGGIMLPDLSPLALPPHLCTPCEVMGREGLRRLTVLGCLSLLISALPAR